LIPRRTFIARCSITDGTVVLENSLTRERVRVRSLSEIPDQIERWLEAGLTGTRPSASASGSSLRRRESA
jgi:hypothetical protein